MQIKNLGFKKKELINQIQFKLDIGLFACRINKKIPKFVSFKTDLESIAVNTFNMDWRIKILKFFTIHLCTTYTAKEWKLRALRMVIVPDGLTKSGSANT